MKETQTENRVMSIKEVSEFLRIPISTAYELAKRGKLGGTKFGRHWRFLEEDILAYFKRAVALFVLLTFSFTSVLQAQPVPVPAAEAPSAQKVFKTLLPENVQLPAGLGKIQEAYQASPEAPVVAIIQDAHAIPEAQRNIQKLIEYFQTEYGVALVGLEGAVSQLDPQIFRSFPDKEILKKVFEEYFEKGELTGPTAAAIFNENTGLYHGIEDWGLYEEALRLYVTAMEGEAGLLEKFAVLERELEAKKEAAYSKELLEVDRGHRAFHKDHSDFAPFLKTLAAVKKPEPGTELAAILEQPENGETDLLRSEVRKLAEQVLASLRGGPVGRRSNLSEFHQKLQEFQTSRISAAAFGLFLKETAPDLEISAELSSALDREKRMQNIEGLKFFRDFERYVVSVKESLFRNEEEKSLDRESRKIGLLEKLIRLELTREEWDEIRSSRAPLMEEMPAHAAFYQNAERRDEAFFNNLTNFMKRDNALLVAGGFHAEGLMERLKARGISYLLLTPHINSVPENTPYRDQMKGDVSWKDYFEPENGRIHLYKAFVRAARDRLLKEGDGRLAKTWRDQIIRDLSGKRVTDAGQYTRFLDEVAKRDHAQNPKFQRVEKFLEGLRRLDAKKELTGENVFKLLQPSHAASLVASIADPSASLAADFAIPRSDRPLETEYETAVRSEMRNLEARPTDSGDVEFYGDDELVYTVNAPQSRYEWVAGLTAAFQALGIDSLPEHEISVTEDDEHENPGQILIEIKSPKENDRPLSQGYSMPNDPKIVARQINLIFRTLYLADPVLPYLISFSRVEEDEIQRLIGNTGITQFYRDLREAIEEGMFISNYGAIISGKLLGIELASSSGWWMDVQLESKSTSINIMDVARLTIGNDNSTLGQETVLLEGTLKTRAEKRDERLEDLVAGLQERVPGINEEQIRDAYALAAKIHKGHPRADKTDHVLSVTDRIIKRYLPERWVSHPLMIDDWVSAALLHDVIEDGAAGSYGKKLKTSGIPEDKIRQTVLLKIEQKINPRVAQLVWALSRGPEKKNPAINDQRRDDRAYDDQLLDPGSPYSNLHVQLIKLADREDNYGKFMRDWFTEPFFDQKGRRAPYEIARSLRFLELSRKLPEWARERFLEFLRETVLSIDPEITVPVLVHSVVYSKRDEPRSSLTVLDWILVKDPGAVLFIQKTLQDIPATMVVSVKLQKMIQTHARPEVRSGKEKSRDPQELLAAYRNSTGREKAWALADFFRLLKLGQPWETRNQLRELAEQTGVDIRTLAFERRRSDLSLPLPDDLKDMIQSYAELQKALDTLSSYSIEDLVRQRPDLVEESLLEQILRDLEPGSKSYYISWELVAPMAIALSDTSRQRLQREVFRHFDSAHNYIRWKAIENVGEMAKDGTIALTEMEQIQFMEKLKDKILHDPDAHASGAALETMYELMRFNPDAFYSLENVDFIEDLLYLSRPKSSVGRISLSWVDAYNRHLDWIAEHAGEAAKMQGESAGSTFLAQGLAHSRWEKIVDYLLDHMFDSAPAVDLFFRLFTTEHSLHTEERIQKILQFDRYFVGVGPWVGLHGALKIAQTNPKIFKRPFLIRLVTMLAKEAQGSFYLNSFHVSLPREMGPLLEHEAILSVAEEDPEVAQAVQDLQDMIGLAHQLNEADQQHRLSEEYGRVASIFHKRWGIHLEVGLTDEDLEDIFVNLGDFYYGDQRRRASFSGAPAQDLEEDPYKTLGVTPEQSDKEIQSAYRGLALKSHPDKNPGDPEAAKKFVKIQRAFEAIFDKNGDRRRTEMRSAPSGLTTPKDRVRAKGSPYHMIETHRGDLETALEELYPGWRDQEAGLNPARIVTQLFPAVEGLPPSGAKLARLHKVTREAIRQNKMIALWLLAWKWDYDLDAFRNAEREQAVEKILWENFHEQKNRKFIFRGIQSRSAVFKALQDQVTALTERVARLEEVLRQVAPAAAVSLGASLAPKPEPSAEKSSDSRTEMRSENRKAAYAFIKKVGEIEWHLRHLASNISRLRRLQPAFEAEIRGYQRELAELQVTDLTELTEYFETKFRQPSGLTPSEIDLMKQYLRKILEGPEGNGLVEAFETYLDLPKQVKRLENLIENRKLQKQGIIKRVFKASIGIVFLGLFIGGAIFTSLNHSAHEKFNRIRKAPPAAQSKLLDELNWLDRSLLIWSAKHEAEEEDAALRRGAYETLFLLNAPETADVLTAGLKDLDSKSRQRAAILLGDFLNRDPNAHPKAMVALFTALDNPFEEKEIRREIARALGKGMRDSYGLMSPTRKILNEQSAYDTEIWAHFLDGIGQNVRQREAEVKAFKRPEMRKDEERPGLKIHEPKYGEPGLTRPMILDSMNVIHEKEDLPQALRTRALQYKTAISKESGETERILLEDAVYFMQVTLIYENLVEIAAGTFDDETIPPAARDYMAHIVEAADEASLLKIAIAPDFLKEIRDFISEVSSPRTEMRVSPPQGWSYREPAGEEARLKRELFLQIFQKAAPPQTALLKNWKKFSRVLMDQKGQLVAAYDVWFHEEEMSILGQSGKQKAVRVTGFFAVSPRFTKQGYAELFFKLIKQEWRDRGLDFIVGDSIEENKLGFWQKQGGVLWTSYQTRGNAFHRVIFDLKSLDRPEMRTPLMAMRDYLTENDDTRALENPVAQKVHKAALAGLAEFSGTIHELKTLLREDGRGHGVLNKMVFEIMRENRDVRRKIFAYKKILDGRRDLADPTLTPAEDSAWKVIEARGIGDVLFVSPEAAPFFSMAGGMAPAVWGIAKNLADHGVSIVIVSILYEQSKGEKGKNHRTAKDLIDNGVFVNGKNIKPAPILDSANKIMNVKIPFGPLVEGHNGGRRIVQPGHTAQADLYQAEVEGVSFRFLREPELGNVLYPDFLYPNHLRPFENARRTIFLSRGTLEIAKTLDIFPDYIASHDWMASYIPAYLRVDLAKPGNVNHAPGNTDYRDDIHFRQSGKTRTKTVKFGHNDLFDYQQSHYNVAKVPVGGREHWVQLFPMAGMAEEHYFGFADPVRREHINPAQGHTLHADAAWTPSPAHGTEMLDRLTGESLHKVFLEKLPWNFGISNFVFLDESRREVDDIGKKLIFDLKIELEAAGPNAGALRQAIEEAIDGPLDLDQAEAEYSEKDFEKNLLLYRALAKRFSQKQHGMREDLKAPLVGFVGRTAKQKGVELIRRTVKRYLDQNPQAQIFSGGPVAKGDEEAEGFHAVLAELKNDPKYQDRIGLHLGHSVFLNREEILKAYLAMDIFLMPSEREPGGITQIEALAAGVPLIVAHLIGGIADTIHPFDPESQEGNGFFFENKEKTAGGFRSTETEHNFLRALQGATDAILRNPGLTKMKSVENAMRAAKDWSVQTPYYLAMLRYIDGAWLEDDPELEQEKAALRKIQVGQAHIRRILGDLWDELLYGIIEFSPTEEIQQMSSPQQAALIFEDIQSRLHSSKLTALDRYFFSRALDYYYLLEPVMRTELVTLSPREKEFVRRFHSLLPRVVAALSPRAEMRSATRVAEPSRHLVPGRAEMREFLKRLNAYKLDVEKLINVLAWFRNQPPLTLPGHEETQSRIGGAIDLLEGTLAVLKEDWETMSEDDFWGTKGLLIASADALINRLEATFNDDVIREGISDYEEKLRLIYQGYFDLFFDRFSFTRQLKGGYATQEKLDGLLRPLGPKGKIERVRRSRESVTIQMTPFSHGDARRWYEVTIHEQGKPWVSVIQKERAPGSDKIDFVSTKIVLGEHRGEDAIDRVSGSEFEGEESPEKYRIHKRVSWPSKTEPAAGTRLLYRGEIAKQRALLARVIELIGQDPDFADSARLQRLLDAASESMELPDEDRSEIRSEYRVLAVPGALAPALTEMRTAGEIVEFHKKNYHGGLNGLQEYPHPQGRDKILKGFELKNGIYVPRHFQPGAYGLIHRIDPDHPLIREAIEVFLSFVKALQDEFPGKKIHYWHLGDKNPHLSLGVFQEHQELLTEKIQLLTAEDVKNIGSLMGEKAGKLGPINAYRLGYGVTADGGFVIFLIDSSGRLLDFKEKMLTGAGHITGGKVSGRPKPAAHVTAGRVLWLPYSEYDEATQIKKKKKVLEIVNDFARRFQEEWEANIRHPEKRLVYPIDSASLIHETQWLSVAGDFERTYPFRAEQREKVEVGLAQDPGVRSLLQIEREFHYERQITGQVLHYDAKASQNGYFIPSGLRLLQSFVKKFDLDPYQKANRQKILEKVLTGMIFFAVSAGLVFVGVSLMTAIFSGALVSILGLSISETAFPKRFQASIAREGDTGSYDTVVITSTRPRPEMRVNAQISQDPWRVFEKRLFLLKTASIPSWDWSPYLEPVLNLLKERAPPRWVFLPYAETLIVIPAFFLNNLAAAFVSVASSAVRLSFRKNREQLLVYIEFDKFRELEEGLHASRNTAGMKVDMIRRLLHYVKTGDEELRGAAFVGLLFAATYLPPLKRSLFMLNKKGGLTGISPNLLEVIDWPNNEIRDFLYGHVLKPVGPVESRLEMRSEDGVDFEETARIQEKLGLSPDGFWRLIEFLRVRVKTIPGFKQKTRILKYELETLFENKGLTESEIAEIIRTVTLSSRSEEASPVFIYSFIMIGTLLGILAGYAFRGNILGTLGGGFIGYMTAVFIMISRTSEESRRMEMRELEEAVSAMEKEFGIDPRDHDRFLSLLVPTNKNKEMRRIFMLRGTSAVKLAANQYAMQELASPRALRYQLFMNRARENGNLLPLINADVYQAYAAALPSHQVLAEKNVVLILLAFAAGQGNWTKIHSLLQKRFQNLAAEIQQTEKPVKKQDKFQESFVLLMDQMAEGMQPFVAPGFPVRQAIEGVVLGYAGGRNRVNVNQSYENLGDAVLDEVVSRAIAGVERLQNDFSSYEGTFQELTRNRTFDILLRHWFRSLGAMGPGHSRKAPADFLEALAAIVYLSHGPDVRAGLQNASGFYSWLVEQYLESPAGENEALHQALRTFLSSAVNRAEMKSDDVDEATVVETLWDEPLVIEGDLVVLNKEKAEYFFGMQSPAQRILNEIFEVTEGVLRHDKIYFHSHDPEKNPGANVSVDTNKQRLIISLPQAIWMEDEQEETEEVKEVAADYIVSRLAYFLTRTKGEKKDPDFDKKMRSLDVTLFMNQNRLNPINISAFTSGFFILHLVRTLIQHNAESIADNYAWVMIHHHRDQIPQSNLFSDPRMSEIFKIFLMLSFIFPLLGFTYETFALFTYRQQRERLREFLASGESDPSSVERYLKKVESLVFENEPLRSFFRKYEVWTRNEVLRYVVIPLLGMVGSETTTEELDQSSGDRAENRKNGSLHTYVPLKLRQGDVLRTNKYIQIEVLEVSEAARMVRLRMSRSNKEGTAVLNSNDYSVPLNANASQRTNLAAAVNARLNGFKREKAFVEFGLPPGMEFQQKGEKHEVASRPEMRGQKLEPKSYRVGDVEINVVPGDIRQQKAEGVIFPVNTAFAVGGSSAAVMDTVEEQSGGQDIYGLFPFEVENPLKLTTDVVHFDLADRRAISKSGRADISTSLREAGITLEQEWDRIIPAFVRDQGKEDDLDKDIPEATSAAIDIANENGLQSVVMVPFGTGILGISPQHSAALMIPEIVRYAQSDRPHHVKKITIVMNKAAQFKQFDSIANKLLRPEMRSVEEQIKNAGKKMQRLFEEAENLYLKSDYPGAFKLYQEVLHAYESLRKNLQKSSGSKSKLLTDLRRSMKQVEETLAPLSPLYQKASLRIGWFERMGSEADAFVRSVDLGPNKEPILKDPIHWVEAHRRGTRHATSQVIMVTQDGRVLVQWRPDGKFDISAAGHVHTSDQSFEDAAIRVIQNESGLANVRRENLKKLARVVGAEKHGTENFEGAPYYDNEEVFHWRTNEANNRESSEFFIYVLSPEEERRIHWSAKDPKRPHKIDFLPLRTVEHGPAETKGLIERIQELGPNSPAYSSYASTILQFFLHPRNTDLLEKELMARYLEIIRKSKKLEDVATAGRGISLLSRSAIPKTATTPPRFRKGHPATDNVPGVFVFDVDRTLARRNGRLSEGMRRNLKALLKLGFRVVIITGQGINVQYPRLVEDVMMEEGVGASEIGTGERFSDEELDEFIFYGSEGSLKLAFEKGKLREIEDYRKGVLAVPENKRRVRDFINLVLNQIKSAQLPAEHQKLLESKTAAELVQILRREPPEPLDRDTAIGFKIAGFKDHPQNQALRELLLKILELRLAEEGIKGVDVAASGTTTTAIVPEGVDKATAMHDILQDVPAEWVIYFGDEYTRSGNDFAIVRYKRKKSNQAEGLTVVSVGVKNGKPLRPKGSVWIGEGPAATETALGKLVKSLGDDPSLEKRRAAFQRWKSRLARAEVRIKQSVEAPLSDELQQQLLQAIYAGYKVKEDDESEKIAAQLNAENALRRLEEVLPRVSADYVVTEFLGSGFEVEVYKLENKRTGQLVALQVAGGQISDTGVGMAGSWKLRNSHKSLLGMRFIVRDKLIRLGKLDTASFVIPAPLPGGFIRTRFFRGFLKELEGATWLDVLRQFISMIGTLVRNFIRNASGRGDLYLDAALVEFIHHRSVIEGLNDGDLSEEEFRQMFTSFIEALKELELFYYDVQLNNFRYRKHGDEKFLVILDFGLTIPLIAAHSAPPGPITRTLIKFDAGLDHLKRSVQRKKMLADLVALNQTGKFSAEDKAALQFKENEPDPEIVLALGDEQFEEFQKIVLARQEMRTETYEKMADAVMEPEKLGRTELRQISDSVALEVKWATFAGFAGRLREAALGILGREAMASEVPVFVDPYVAEAVEVLMNRWTGLIKARQKDILPAVAVDILPENDPLTIEGLIDSLIAAKGQIGMAIFSGETKGLDAQRHKLEAANLKNATVGNLNQIGPTRIDPFRYLAVLRKSQNAASETNPLQMNIGVDPGDVTREKWNPVLERGESNLQLVAGLLLTLLTQETADKILNREFQQEIAAELFQGKVRGEVLKYEIKKEADGRIRISVTVDRPLLLQFIQSVANELRARAEIRKAA